MTQSPPNHSNNPSSAEVHFLQEKTITLKKLPASGWILDVGGGGEGVIGQMEGSRVVAVDTSRRELEEAPPGPLKLVMDARKLQFLDHSFAAATCFFSLMFIPPDDHPKVLQEIHRVLKPGGKFYLWEVDLPARSASSPDLIAVRLTIQLPDREVRTGYGTRWPKKRLGIDHYRSAAAEVGFRLEGSQSQEGIFQLTFSKVDQ